MSWTKWKVPGNGVETLSRLGRATVIVLLGMLLGVMLLCTPGRAQESEAKTFFIYFPYQHSNVTVEAYKVAIFIANSVGTSKNSRIVIVGYCDTSEGSPEELSKKRAENAAAALRAAGLTDSIPVETSGRGAKDLAVPTPPNTREPLNDRALVEIESPSK